MNDSYLLQRLVVNKTCGIFGYLELAFLDMFAELPARRIHMSIDRKERGVKGRESFKPSTGNFFGYTYMVSTTDTGPQQWLHQSEEEGKATVTVRANRLESQPAKQKHRIQAEFLWIVSCRVRVVGSWVEDEEGSRRLAHSID